MDKDTLKTVLIYGGMLLLIFLVLNKFFGFTDKWREEAAEKERKQADEAQKGNEEAKLRKDGIKASMPPSKFNDLAAALFTAMKGGGTDTNRVFQIISNLHNDLDFILLNKAFGVREDENLSQWINGDISSGDIAKLNQYLRSRKIKYAF